MLTVEQKQLVEEHLWVAKAVLKKYGLARDKDWQSIANLELIKCATKYDRAYGVKFSTYAYKSILLAIRRIRYKETAQNGKIVPLETANEIPDTLSSVDTAIRVTEIKANLTRREIAVCELLEQGYNYKEVAFILGKTRQGIYCIRERIKNKIPPS